MATGVGLHLGLNSVDPGHYQGWDGTLLACENDANDMQHITQAAGFTTTKLLTRRCTRAAVTEQLERAVAQLDDGDCFIVTYSGHGGQVPDRNGEEADGYDETLCLFDAEWLDDETNQMLRRFRPGVRVLFVLDKCHAGSDMRAGPRRAMPSQIAAATYAAHRRFYDAITDLTRSIGTSQTIRASAMTLGACEDGQVALDGQYNGRFTGALKTIWHNGAFTGDYVRFHADISDRMPPSQTPTITTEGTHIIEFLHDHPFTIERTRNMTTRTIARAPDNSGATLTPSATSPFRTAKATRDSTVPTWGRSRPGEAKPANRTNEPEETLADGDYVAARGSADKLYLFQGGQLEPVSPLDAVAAGLTQADVNLVEASKLLTLPVIDSRGTEQTFHWWSDLGAGHFMESWAWTEPGKVMVRTVTETVTWFGGWTGAATAVLARADDSIIAEAEVYATFGCDGRAFGSGRRDETYEWTFSQEIIDQIHTIHIVHGWSPKTDWVQNMVMAIKFIYELYERLGHAKGEGQPVNVGSDAG